MALRFFNTYSRQLEDFEPRDPASREIGIYTVKNGKIVEERFFMGGH